MKKLILLIFLAVQMNLMAQEFFPIPVDTTSVWRVAREHNDETCVWHYNSIYYIDGTILKWGKEYYKIYEEGHFYYSSVNPQYPCVGGWDYSGVFRGAIRTEGRKTYGWAGSDGSPGLLMDFTLDIGDTLFSDISYGCIINSIDSVLVGDQYRKRFNMSNYWGESIWMVEGVGHQKGLFESMNPFEGDSWNICYGENGTPIYGNGNCDITVGQTENQIQIGKVYIYPNPTSNKFKVKIFKLNNVIESYLLTDIYGNIIVNKNTEMLNQSEFEINVENLKSGIYLLIINMNNNKSIHRKILKK